MVYNQIKPGSILRNRLVEAGVPFDEIKIETDNESEEYTVTDSKCVEVKTLVWEVSCHQNDLVEENKHIGKKFYFISVQKMSDKVELSLLRDLVFKHQDLPFGCTPSKLSMAPKDVAEKYTGFQSGCMPPIGHDVKMKVYFEKSLTEGYQTASIGSGTLGHSLFLPMNQLLSVAENHTKGLLVGNFVRLPLPKQPQSFSDDTENEGLTTTKMPKTKRQEPKDRIGEYKSLKNLVDKAKLLRTTARKKGRFDVMKLLVDQAIERNEFAAIMETSEEDGLDKNALHLSAWRGDFETVKLLVETSQKYCPELDIVNRISKGSGNYGKTPIFYALTQCREDVVRYLVSQGASLLFVNNKGQTPCSIAVSHLEQDACEFLFQNEAKQLQEGNTFVNYRDSHSDKKLYGDLDPRFPIDVVNMGDDILVQLAEYKESLSKDKDEHVYNGIPTRFSPRSVRATVRWWKRSSSRQITFTQPRATSEKKSKQKPPQQKHLGGSESVQKERNWESLEVLKIDQVLDLHLPSQSDEPRRILVNCSESMKILESDIDDMVEHSIALCSDDKVTPDEIFLSSIWGLDCEWLPGVECGKDNPVATLQLSTTKRAFLLDLQSLCQPLHLEDDENVASLTDKEAQLNNILEKLFTSSSLSIVGYGVLQDLGKLAASFPHLQCFSYYKSVVDLISVSSIAIPKSEHRDVSSLQRMVACLLNKRLDKKQQCSDWSKRPLSKEQLDYAMLDSAVLPLLLKCILEGATIERYNGQFFTVHSNLKLSVQFTLLKGDEFLHVDSTKEIIDVPMGRITSLFSRMFARQCWPKDQPLPGLPRKVQLKSDGTNMSKKERAHLRKVGILGSKKAKPVQLKDIAGNLDNLPIAGTTLGYTKDSCVFRVVGHTFLNTLPEGTYIGFNRRSGVIETTNAFLIFCNFGGSREYYGKKSGSGFLKGGKDLIFNLKLNNYQGKSSERSLFASISDDVKHTAEKTILLFARDGTRKKYTYCGHCECQRFIEKECGSVDLLLNLVHFTQLVGENRLSSDFVELVETYADNSMVSFG